VKTLIPIICFFWLFNISLAEETFRTWTSSDGRKLEAKFIEMVGNSVKIKNTQGREFILPLNKLSQADQEYAKLVSQKALFNLPKPFDERDNWGIIITSVKGKVRVIHASLYSDSKEVKPVPRDAIVGESLPKGSVIVTGPNSETDLLFTNGSIAKLGASSVIVLSEFWQKKFQPSAKKVVQTDKEVSSSRVALKLEVGDLIVDVKKLNKDSSFMVESKLGVAGVRGTQFGLSVNSKSTELAILEGKVGFKDTNQKTKMVETSQNIVGVKEGASNVGTLPEARKNELANAVANSKKVASNYDLKRLANAVDGYASKSNYKVKSALGMELIWCPPGSFVRSEGGVNHSVILTKGFYLGKYEVTQEQYKKVMGNDPSGFTGKNLPVENVSWDDAVKFCKILTKNERIHHGWEFTLPTEAQWEYACRAGTATIFSWGNQINPKLANYDETGFKSTCAVGSYRQNPWGFYDMHGNADEWCKDWFGKYPTGSVFDPIGVASGTGRCVRGGSWFFDWSRLRSVDRGLVQPSLRCNYIGFRLSFQSIK
jgi:formylglycine-generating enzyme required for sulfatase activity